MRVIAYTWLADYHCVACTVAARDAARLRLQPSADPPYEDEHGLAESLGDREGNLIHPVFGTDEGPTRDDGTAAGAWCADCGAEILPPG